MTQEREREHRLALQPYNEDERPLAPPPKIKRVITADSDDEDGTTSEPSFKPSALYNINRGFTIGNDGWLEHDEADPAAEREDQVLEDAVAAWAHGVMDADGSEDGEDQEERPYTRLEDSDSEDDKNRVYDWASIEAGRGLSALERLGENYEREAASIGTGCYFLFTLLRCLLCVL